MPEFNLETPVAFCNKCGLGLRCEGCSSIAKELEAARVALKRKDTEIARAYNDVARVVNQRAMLVVALRDILNSKGGTFRQTARDVLDALDYEMKAKA